MNQKRNQGKALSKSVSQSKAQETGEKINPSLDALISDLASHDDGKRVKARHPSSQWEKLPCPHWLKR